MQLCLCYMLGAWGFPGTETVVCTKSARLARALPETVLRSRADSTTKKYLGAYRRWKSWVAQREGLVAFPVNVAHFALYLLHVGETTQSRAAVEEAVCAMAWVQRMAGAESLAKNVMIKSVVEGFQRMLAKPKRKKEPVKPQLLQEIVASMSVIPTLTEVRLSNICLLAYAAFLRYDELGKLRCCDVSFFPENMEIAITSSKTDQLRQGKSVPIAQSVLPTCPVAMMK